MFDWDDGDGVADTIWGNFEIGDYLNREDHIVPYPKDGDDGASEIGDYLNKQDKKQKCTPDCKNEFLPICSPDSNSYVNTKELPGSRYKMDLWTNFSIGNAFDSGGSSGNDQGATSSTMVNDFTDAPYTGHAEDSTFTELCQSADMVDDSNTSSFKESHGFSFHDRAECDSKPSGFSSEHDHKEVASFLDCDWGSITDFDELDGILGDGGSIFGQEMTRNVDELLSPTDSTNATTFTMHDISMSTNAEAGKHSCSLQESRFSQEKKKNSKDDKIADQTASGKQMGFLPKFTCATYQSGGHDSDNVDGKNMELKSRRKIEEKRKTKSRKRTPAFSNNGSQIQQFDNYRPISTSSQAFTSPAYSQQGHPGGPGYMGYYSSSHQAFTGYGYPAFPFPSIPVIPYVHAVREHPQPAPASYNIYSQQAGHSDSVQNLDVTSKAPIMTPQEKIEKLRRRQQMRAMLAIKQQGKQFGQQVGSTDITLSPKLVEMNPCQDSVPSSIEKTEEHAKGVCTSELNMPLDQDGSHIVSVTSDDYALQETILCEFQETVMKLDDNLRMCMKESILRLANGVTERRSANGGSSSNANGRKEGMISANERLSAAPDMERDTNAIDRIVVHLLFHPMTSFTNPDKGSPPSPIPGNARTKQSSIWECITEDKGKMAME